MSIISEQSVDQQIDIDKNYTEYPNDNDEFKYVMKYDVVDLLIGIPNNEYKEEQGQCTSVEEQVHIANIKFSDQ